MSEGRRPAPPRVSRLDWRRWPGWARRIATHLLYPDRPIGAAVLIRDDAGRVLLVRQSYQREEAWFPPGGWVGRGETPREAAAREAYEEVGLRVSVGRLLSLASGPYGDVSFLFESRLLDDRDAGLSDEIAGAGYFRPSELPLLDGRTRRWVEEAISIQAGSATAPRRPT